MAGGDVSCGRCGVRIEREVADRADRPPCPLCGSDAIATEVGRAVEVDMALGVQVAMSPPQFQRDAPRRLAEADEELSRLEEPLPDTAPDTVLDRQRRLFHVLGDLVSMRDALRDIVVPSQRVDDAINASRNLGLAHDMGNVSKHGSLDRRPRCPPAVRFGAPRAVRSGSGEGAWRFGMQAWHGDAELDAVRVARQAITEWAGQLERWNLLTD